MGHCGNCRWFNENFCEWWLKPITSTTRRTTCYVPNDCDPHYPLFPKPAINNLRRFDYPRPHRRCLVCGTELSGRKQKYCSSGHRKMYYARFTWTSVRFMVWQRDQKCCHCGIPLIPSEADCDHITPVALGGAFWDYNNLQTLCRSCHAQKTLIDCVDINQAKNQNEEVEGVPSFDTGIIQNLELPVEDHQRDFNVQLRANKPKISSDKSQYRKKLKYMIGRRSRWM